MGSPEAVTESIVGHQRGSPEAVTENIVGHQRGSSEGVTGGGHRRQSPEAVTESIHRELLAPFIHKCLQIRFHSLVQTVPNFVMKIKIN